jgi:hypothetical protein
MSTFAYADPPYIGESRRYQEHPEAARWDLLETHRELLDQLSAYDGWALSMHVPGLRLLLPYLPADARICAWVKPWARMRPGARLQYGWEPVILSPVRHPIGESVWDYVSADASMPWNRSGPRTYGAKPEGFCFWLFAAAGLRPDDELVDLFPGSGAVSRAWQQWRSQPQLVLPATRRQERKAMLQMDL